MPSPAFVPVQKAIEDAAQFIEDDKCSYEDLEKASTRLEGAWKDYFAQQRKAKQSKYTKEQLDTAFVDKFTQHMGDSIQELRQNDAVDVEILADMIQTSRDLWTAQQVEDYCFPEDTTGKDITPHEANRRCLGYHMDDEEVAALGKEEKMDTTEDSCFETKSSLGYI